MAAKVDESMVRNLPYTACVEIWSGWRRQENLLGSAARWHWRQWQGYILEHIAITAARQNTMFYIVFSRFYWNHSPGLDIFVIILNFPSIIYWLLLDIN